MADSVLTGFATSLISGGQGRLPSPFWHSTADCPQVPRHTKRSCLIRHVERVSRFPKTGGELDGSRVTPRANTSLQGLQPRWLALSPLMFSSLGAEIEPEQASQPVSQGGELGPRGRTRTLLPCAT